MTRKISSSLDGARQHPLKANNTRMATMKLNRSTTWRRRRGSRGAMRGLQSKRLIRQHNPSQSGEL